MKFIQMGNGCYIYPSWWVELGGVYAYTGDESSGYQGAYDS